MIKKIIPILAILLLLTNAPFTAASTHANIDLKVLDFSSDISFFDSKANGWQELLLETGVAYNESEDSTQRRGTENWEQSQTSFFIFPAIILGLIALAMFFSRD